jgi:endonuclease YncB( thermonuclease family)
MNRPDHYDSSTPHTLRLSRRHWRWIGIGLAIGFISGVLLGLSAKHALAADVSISGPARVLDGDTIEIAGERIRLHGIDAPELAQTCMAERGSSWSCGIDAATALADIVTDKIVECVRKSKDKYGRTIAVCAVAGHDISATMTCRGQAWAYREFSADYAGHEVDAKTRRAGIWRAETVPAWQFRHEAWDKAVNEAPNGRPIVGVRRSGECIYHAPWTRHYRKLNLSNTRGKTFYADESEALEAGCRAAYYSKPFVKRVTAAFKRSTLEPAPSEGICRDVRLAR